MSRKLDAAIARAAGRDDKEGVIVSRRGMVGDTYGRVLKDGFTERTPCYSTDGNAMLELDKEMRERGHQIEITVNLGQYEAYYFTCHGEWTEETRADTMPEAVALAAYRALTGKEWEGDT